MVAAVRTAAQEGSRRRPTNGREITVSIVRRDGAAAVVEIGGELDLHTSGPLRAVLLSLAEAGHVNIVADFSGVCFCDASGLGVLVAVSNRVREDGGALCLIGVREAQRRILHITRLDKLFPPYETVEEALTAPVGRPDPASGKPERASGKHM